MFIELDIGPEACVSCGVCVDSCPTDVLVQSEAGGKAQVAHLEDCQGCFLCVFDCPVDAIRIKQVRVPIEEIGTEWRDVHVKSRQDVQV